jgi:hypothetical protein
MISKMFDAMFTPKYPRGYTGRHRAEFALASVAKPGLARARAIAGRQATV